MRWLVEGVMLNWLSGVRWLRPLWRGLGGLVHTRPVAAPWIPALCTVASTLVLAACGGGNAGGDTSSSVPSSAIDAVVAAQEASDQRMVVNAADCNWSQGETSTPETFSGCHALPMGVLADARDIANGLALQDTSQVIDPDGTLPPSAMLAQGHAPGLPHVAQDAGVSRLAEHAATTRPEAVAMVSVVEVPKGTGKALISLKDL